MSLKNKLQQWLPSPEKLKADKRLQILGDWLHDPNLWHINRGSVSGACAIGFAAAWMPIPLQMLVAAFFAVILRKNLAVSVVTTWITNPLTVPPMFYFAYWVGAWILDTNALTTNMELNLEWFYSQISHIWMPFLLGCSTMAIISGCIGYYGMQLLWRYHVLTKLRERRKRMLDRLLHHEDKHKDSE